MAAPRGARARSSPPRRLDHAPAAPRHIPQTAGAVARSLAMRCGGTQRVHEEGGGRRRTPRHRRLYRHRRGPPPMARTPARSFDRRRVLRRRNVPPPRDLGCRGADAALPRAAPGAARRETRHLAGAGHEAHGLETSGLLSTRRRSDIGRGHPGAREPGRVCGAKPLVTPEARLPRRPAGGHLQGAQAQSDSGTELRNDGPAGMAGENGGSHPGPGETSHALLRLLCQSRARRSRRRGAGRDQGRSGASQEASL